MRDINLESTIYPKFTTRAFATGIPTTLGGTPVLSVYEENNLTQITAGVSVTADYDSVTGLNQGTIVATAANGYEAGKSYDLVITTGTVGGVSVVGEVVSSFTIEDSAAATDLTNGTDGLSALKAIMDTSGVILTAAATSAQLVDDVWDEILTGATHNIATSAGRRLRGIQEFQGYENGAIWIDTNNGTAGTVDYENGTVENPVDSIADANTLAASLGIARFEILDGSTITFAAAQTGQVFDGHTWTLALGGQNIAGTTIIGASVSGIAAGTGTMQNFTNCVMNAISHIKNTHIHTSSIAGTQTLVEAGDIFFDRCHSGIAGTSTWVFNFGAAIGNSNLNWRNGSGGIQLEAMGDTGTDTASIEGRGQVIEGTCTGGTAAIRGNFTVSGITNITLSDDARFDSVQLVDDHWDELASGHTVAGSFGKILKNSTDIVQLDGSISDAGPLTTDFDTDLTGYGDGYFDDSILVFTDAAANKGIGLPVTGYTSATGNFQFTAPDDWPITPVNADPFVIYAIHVHPVSQIADAVADEDLSGHTTAGTMGALGLGIIYGTAATGTLSTTQATSSLTGYADDQLIGRTIIVTSGAADGEGSDITDYASASGLLTFTAMTTAMANNDTFKIV